MPYKDRDIEKRYYSISEVAESFSVSPSLLRFWEKEFDIIRPRKNRKGDRLYTSKDIDQLRTIYHLVKENGFTLKGARKRLGERPEEAIDKVALIKRLEGLKRLLQRLKQEL